MAYETITLALEDHVAVLTLNRPDRLNALTVGMITELRDAVASAQGQGARCLLLTGAGRGFCAGADLSQNLSADGGPPDLGAVLDAHYNPFIKQLRALEIPVVAAVNGPCAGAGMSLAILADIVIAAESATFLQAFCNIGLVPDAGSTWVLPRQVGRARAAGMALLGDKLPARTAADWGLIWQCVADDQLMPQATAIAKKLAAGPTRGLGLIRQALQASQTNSLEAQLDLERDYQRAAGRTEDFFEGVSAFLQKRPAKFKGR